MVHHGVPQSYSARPRCLQPFASINRSRLIRWSHWHSLSQSQQINLALNALISLNSLGGGDFIIWCGKDVTVTTDDFSLEQKERAQQRQTEQRRQERSRRNRLILFAGGACALCLLFLMPSMISHSSIGRSYLIDYLSAHGLQAEVASVRVGWLTVESGGSLS